MQDHSKTAEAEKQDRIRYRAYMIWEREGRVDGHALAHWARAEELEAQSGHRRPADEADDTGPLPG